MPNQIQILNILFKEHKIHFYTYQPKERENNYKTCKLSFERITIILIGFVLLQLYIKVMKEGFCILFTLWTNTIYIYEVFKRHKALLLDINSASCQRKCKVWLDCLKIRKWANVSFSKTDDQKFTYCVQESVRCGSCESVQYPRSLMLQDFCCKHSGWWKRI